MIAGWCVAIVLGVSSVYGEYKVVREGGEPFTKAENIMYGTFSRFSWGLALAWVIFVCHRGVGGENEINRHVDNVQSPVCFATSFFIFYYHSFFMLFINSFFFRAWEGDVSSMLSFVVVDILSKVIVICLSYASRILSSCACSNQL